MSNNGRTDADIPDGERTLVEDGERPRGGGAGEGEGDDCHKTLHVDEEVEVLYLSAGERAGSAGLRLSNSRRYLCCSLYRCGHPIDIRPLRWSVPYSSHDAFSVVRCTWFLGLSIIGDAAALCPMSTTRVDRLTRWAGEETHALSLTDEV